jgi:hypothetical protein
MSGHHQATLKVIFGLSLRGLEIEDSTNKY